MKSRYSPDKNVTHAQYITEIVCENKAFSQQKELPMQFWKFKEWEKYFKRQIMWANKLLKQYSAEEIIRVLRHNKQIYSLGNKIIHVLIKKEKLRENIDTSTPTICSIFEKPQRTKDNSLVTKLKELE